MIQDSLFSPGECASFRRYEDSQRDLFLLYLPKGEFFGFDYKKNESYSRVLDRKELREVGEIVDRAGGFCSKVDLLGESAVTYLAGFGRRDSSFIPTYELREKIDDITKHVKPLKL